MLGESFGVVSQNTGFYPSLDRIIETTLGPLNLGPRGGSYNEPISRLHRSPQQGIRPTHLPTQLVGQDKVKPGEVQGPSCLAVVQLMNLSEIGQVLVIHVDLELLIRSLEEVPPLL